MKNLKLSFIGTCLLASAMLSGCIKKEEEKPKTTNKPSDQTASSEVDEALNDVNDVINNKVGTGTSQQRIAAYNLPCGVVSIDSVKNSSNHYVYSVHYGDKSSCNPYKYKSGVISFALVDSVAFNKAGSTFLVTFTDYSVEVVATGAIVTINGTIRTTNLSGGWVWEAVTSGATISHKVRGSINVTYPDGQIRSRSYFQHRQWASAGGGWPNLNLTISADTATANYATVSEIGYTYDGNYLYETQITNPFVWGNCGSTWAGPYKLKAAHARLNVTIPNISQAYFDVEGGYYWDGTSTSASYATVPCDANAYKIKAFVTNLIDQTSYQLY
jgi:hypothetical protein